MTPFDGDCQNLQKTPIHSHANSNHFRNIKNIFFQLQKVGHGQRVQFSQLQLSIANVKFTNVSHNLFRQLFPFRYIFFYYLPSKVEQCHEVQFFAIINYKSLANVKVYKLFKHISRQLLPFQIYNIFIFFTSEYRLRSRSAKVDNYTIRQQM